MNQELNNQIKAVEALLASLKAQAKQKEPKPKSVWNPKGGDLCFTRSGNVYITGAPSEQELNFGLYSQTPEQARQLSFMVRVLARQFQWLQENQDGWVADWSNHDQIKFYVYYRYDTKDWFMGKTFKFKDINTVYMSHTNAKKLVELLNSGEVVL